MPTRVRKDTSERPVNTTEHLLRYTRHHPCDLGDHWGMRADRVGLPPAGWTQGSMFLGPELLCAFPEHFGPALGFHPLGFHTRSLFGNARSWPGFPTFQRS